MPGLKDQLSQVQAQQRKLSDTQATLRQKEQTVQEAQRQVSYLESERVRLEKESKEVAEKLDLITSHIASHTEARCPLCNSELTREGLELIAAKYTQEKQSKADSFTANQDKLAHKRAEYEALMREKVQLETTLNQEKSRLQGQEELVKSKIREIEDDSLKLAEQKGLLNDIEQRLVRREFAINEQQALAAIETELYGLGYDPAQHEEARRELDKWRRDYADGGPMDSGMARMPISAAIEEYLDTCVRNVRSKGWDRTAEGVFRGFIQHF